MGKIEPLLPIHKTHHPLGTHRKRVDKTAFFWFSELVVSGMRLMRRVFVPLAQHIVDSKSGEMQVYLSDFGKMV